MWFRLFLHALVVAALLVKVAKAHFPHDTTDAIAVSKMGDEVFVYMRRSVFHSTDYGETFDYIRRFEGYGNTYMALSPYDGTFVMKDKERFYTSTDLLNWDEKAIDTCYKYYYGIHKRGTAFTPSTMVVAGYNIITRDLGGDVIDVVNIGENGCPFLYNVDDSEILYMGINKKVKRSGDAGSTWADVTTTSENIVEVLAIDDNKILVLTEGQICLIDRQASNTCNNINVPDATPSEKFDLSKTSLPIGMGYLDGTLTVILANSFAFKVSNDLGQTWISRNKEHPDEVCCPEHAGEEAWEFDMAPQEHYTFVEKQYIGTFSGVYKTMDNGDFWEYVPLLSTTSNALDLAKDSNGDDILTVTTYSLGAFQGTPGNLHYLPSPSGHTDTAGIVGLEFYNQWYSSPNYAIDGIAFRSQKERLERADGTLIDLPKYGDRKRNIQSLVFSPSFGVDETIFSAGLYLGVVVSYDSGATFASVPGTEYWNVQKLAISRAAASDGSICMVAMVEDFDTKIKTIQVSQDWGQSWTLVSPTFESRDVEVVGNKNSNHGPYIVNIDENGQIYAADCDGSSFQQIQNTTFDSRDLGYGISGMGTTKDGMLFATSFSQGGMMFGKLTKVGNDFTIVDRYYSVQTPFEAATELPRVSSQTPPLKRAGWRSFGNLVAFSSEFETDNTIYACGYNKVWRSIDRGVTWNKVFQLSQSRPPPSPTTSPSPTIPCSPCTNVATDWMVQNGHTCESWSSGINNNCFENSYWNDNNFCQQSCYDAERGYPGDVCCEVVPTSAPVEPCTPCTNYATDWMIDNNLTCRNHTWAIDPTEGNLCESEYWKEGGFCQQSCYDAGVGYDGDFCCPLPLPSCVTCNNIATDWMIENNLSCLNHTWAINPTEGNLCKTDYWKESKFCQKSCYDAGVGYFGDLCCS